MIAQTAAYADGDSAAPLEVEIGALIDRYGVPAVLGERADYFRLKRIAYLSNVVAAVRTMRSATGDQIHRIPDTYLAILDDLIKRGLWR